MINTVIFDLDDTLYNERDFVYGAFGEVCEYLSIKFKLNYNMLFDDTIKILNSCGRGKIFNSLCEKYNLKEDVGKLIDIYRGAKPKLDLYEDAKWVLDFLISSSKNSSTREQVPYKVGIITDGKASVQWNKIKALELEKKVDKIIVTDDFGIDFWKPNEFSYREMMKAFNVTADQCVYIGDNPNKDFINAKKIGMNTVRIIRDNGDHMKTFLEKEYEADFIINNLRQLIKLDFFI